MNDVIVPGVADASLVGAFWGARAQVHFGPALDHQWEQLEATGAIECFRIAAGRSDALRSAHFTSDSDVYKWLDAAARTLAHDPSPQLVERFDELVELIEQAQGADGYLNTWIQAYFPRGRFQNLQLEHEHYCLGHLIEAGVSHHQATGSTRLLDVARRAADLLVREFTDAPAARVDGHEEIELALIRLHRSTGDPTYLELASRFVERRGTDPHVGRHFVASLARTVGRYAKRARAAHTYRRAHPDWTAPPVPERRHVASSPAIVARLIRSSVSGAMFQTDRPVRAQTTPSGHAVRYLYLQTAAAMLARAHGDDSLRRSTAQAWDRYVDAHLFVNGGAGALPLIEGFAEPYALDPELAYAETCASLGGVFWNREMGLLTGEACYDDLLEWQLLNGAGVGMSTDGASYFYDNPLQVEAGFGRQAWFQIPCCPSNLSRTWASLATLQFSRSGDELRVHQYFASRATVGDASIEVDSDLPWSGEVVVRISHGDVPLRRVALRIPSWVDQPVITVDGAGSPVDVAARPPARPTASGLDPRQARWAHIDLPDEPSCTLRVVLDPSVRLLRQHHRVPKVGGRCALARGPVLYCLDGADHPELVGAALHDVDLDPASIVEQFDRSLCGGAVELRARSVAGDPLRFIPYHLWGNRGAHGMTVFVGAAREDSAPSV